MSTSPSSIYLFFFFLAMQTRQKYYEMTMELAQRKEELLKQSNDVNDLQDQLKIKELSLKDLENQQEQLEAAIYEQKNVETDFYRKYNSKYLVQKKYILQNYFFNLNSVLIHICINFLFKKDIYHSCKI